MEGGSHQHLAAPSMTIPDGPNLEAQVTNHRCVVQGFGSVWNCARRLVQGAADERGGVRGSGGEEE